MNSFKTNRIFASALGFSLLAILFSLVVEYGYSIKPCRLCIWQRWGYISILSVSFFGILFEKKDRILKGVFLLLLGLFCLSTYHALVQYGFFADPCVIPKVSHSDDFWNMINAPLPCSKVSFSIFGIPISVFNSIFTLAFMVFVFITNLNSKRNERFRISEAYKSFKFWELKE
jgi:disulfide bond formation protein DsbB